MVSIFSALDRIKRKPLQFVDKNLIERVCHELGYRWRDGPLDPANTIALFIRQIIEGNCSCQTVRHLGEKPFSGPAYCQARSRLPLAVVREIGWRVARAAAESSDARWRGHRVFHIDGSSFSMPDTPQLQKHFGQSGQQKAGCGFPLAHLLTLFNANNGLILDAIASPLRTHDMAKAALTHASLGVGDLLVGDRAFGTWGHIALILRGQMHGLFPNHQLRIVSFRPHRRHRKPGKFKVADKGLPTSRFVRRLGKNDQLVEWFKPGGKPMWMSEKEFAELPESIVVREVRRVIRRKGLRPITVTLVTTLLDAERYPADELVELARRRWDVETNLRHLKTTLKMDVVKCKSVDNVLKELNVFLLVYNLTRIVMLEAAHRQGVNLDRVSFADALAWLRHARPGETLGALTINPRRPDRIEPRAIKRRPKEYDRLNRPRIEMRNALKNRRKNA